MNGDQDEECGNKAEVGKYTIITGYSDKWFSLLSPTNFEYNH